MPAHADRIMKIDPNNGDAMSSVGDHLRGDWIDYDKYIGTVVGIDGCVYGIPDSCSRIVKYDPINDITSFVGEEADFDCNGNGILARDGCTYVAVGAGRVLKIDTTNNSHCIVGNTVESDCTEYEFGYTEFDSEWGDAILGIDGCVY